MDPRIARTRTLLQDALLSLARERDLDDISVADIADRATINRSTFYQHYADKDTLLADALDEQARRAGADLADPAMLHIDPLALLARYATHMAENAALYRRVLGDHGSPGATARLRRRIHAMALTGVSSHRDDFDRIGLPLEIAAAGITGSLVGVLTTWLDMDPRPSPERAAAWAWTMLLPNDQPEGCTPEL